MLCFIHIWVRYKWKYKFEGWTGHGPVFLSLATNLKCILKLLKLSQFGNKLLIACVWIKVSDSKAWIIKRLSKLDYRLVKTGF